MIMIFLLKHDKSDSNIFLFQNPNQHLSSMALILWTTKDQALMLISSLGVKNLFYVISNSYPTTEFPYNINSTTSTWFSFKNWTKIQEQSQLVQTSVLPIIPLDPKTSEAPTKQQVLFLGQNTFHT
jgi:hypothetical protein